MDAKFTVTCFKRKNNKSGDSFINSYGSSRPEWDVLKEDASLISLKCDFQLVEYEDIRSLQNGYDKKVDKPLYIDVRYLDNYNTSIGYHSMLLATHIAAFAIEFAKKYETTSIIVNVTPTLEGKEVNNDLAIQASSDTTIVSPPTASFSSGWKLPITIVGGAMFIALLAVGILFIDWRKKKGSKLQSLSPFLLSEVPEKSEDVDFTNYKTPSQTNRMQGLL